MNIEPVARVLEALGAAHALIGAHAMAVRGYPRFTVDVDILTADERVLEATSWSGLVRQGAVVEPHRGDADDPLGGVVHILLADSTDVDLVVARWSWEARIVERAEPVSVGGLLIRVPRRSDLILLKLAAGGYTDLHDAAALLALDEADTVIRDVNAHIDEVRPDVRHLWHDLLAAREQ